MSSKEQELLLRVLQERQIPLNADDVAWAFAAPETREKAEAFVGEFLQPPTLLSRDEAEFCGRNGITGTATPDSIAKYGRPLSDAEFERAIDSLEASTAAIERQCQSLNTQKQALGEIQARNASTARTATLAHDRQKKYAQEGAQLEFEIEDLSHAARDRLHSASKLTDAATSALPSQVERVLEKDDRLLDGLQKLLPKVSDPPPEDEQAATVEQLCSVLAAVSINEIRARLDRVYHEGVRDQEAQQNGTAHEGLSEHQKKQRDTLRTELSELSSEIDGLVAIVIDHEYRKPLKQSKMRAITESHIQKARWSEYTIAALAYLTARIDAISQHAQRLHAHSAALQAISTTLETAAMTSQQARSGASNAITTPIVERGNAKGLKPLRLVQANLSEGQDPANQFLRQHDIRVSDADPPRKSLEALAKAMQDRHQRLSNLSKATEQTITDGIVQSLAQIQDNVQHVTDAVYANSTSSSIALVDGTVQTGLDSLESETQGLSAEMRTMDPEAQARALQNGVLRKLTSQG